MVKYCYKGFYEGFVPDKRIERRLEKTMTQLVDNGTSIVNKLVPSLSEKIGVYRMLSNDRFDYKDLLKATHRQCRKNIDVKHVLAIQDTTEFNYHGIKTKLSKEDSDVGPTSIDNIAGYFCHPMLIVDPTENTLFGLSSAIIYNRSWDKKNKRERKYAQQPIEDKESYRWIQSAEQTKSLIDSDVKITIIGDRESDIYEEFVRVPDQRTFILVRSRADRCLSNSDKKLYSYLSGQPAQGSHNLHLSASGKRKPREAKIEVRFCEVKINAPQNYKGEQKEVVLTAIEAIEVTQNIPSDDAPLLWRLLTTHKIESLEEANECIEWYKKRWLIEELFRVIKTKGFKIESSQLGKGSSLKKLLVMTLEAALEAMRLKLSLNQKECSASQVFSKEKIAFLTFMQTKVEGKTLKQKNPYKKNTLAWAAWTIARLAGWSGYKSHGSPGYITIKEGLDRFNLQFDVYLSLMFGEKDVYKD